MTALEILLFIFDGVPVVPVITASVAVGCLGVLLWMGLEAVDETD